MMTNFATLPAEIVSLIMAHLDQQELYTCTMVNTQFYAGANGLLWHTVHFQSQPNSVGICFLHCLVLAKRSVGRSIRHVHLQGFSWTDRTLMLLMRHAPLLTTLVLDNATRITDASMQHITHYCPYLQSLHLDSSPITHISYRVLGQQLPQLTTLELWNCPGLQSDTFSVYFIDSPLERLMLATWVDDDGMVEEEEEEEATIDLTGLDQLMQLKVYGPSFGILNHAIKVNNQGDVYFCWPRLSLLDLEACFDMTDVGALSLLLGFPPILTHLTMKDGDFSNITLNAIATYQPHLVELDISFNNQFTPRGIRRLVRSCRRLAFIKLSYCGMMMDDFPEAGPECEGTVVTFENTFTGLDHLDQRAIDVIRRGSDLLGDQEEEEEEEQDSDGD